MGCCGSRELTEDLDENPHERSRLLATPRGSISRINQMDSEQLEYHKEQERIQKIVNKTAENLIDISSTQATERAFTTESKSQPVNLLPPTLPIEFTKSVLPNASQQQEYGQSLDISKDLEYMKQLSAQVKKELTPNLETGDYLANLK